MLRRIRGEKSGYGVLVKGPDASKHGVITTFNSIHSFHAAAFCVCVAFDSF